jgi:2-deoxy-D-gluconate 3-dehydrogenase
MERQKEPYKFPRYNLENKVAVVTGAGQGLGKWIALGLAEAGANILVTDLVEENANKTAKEIKKMGRESIFMVLDVGDIPNISKVMDVARRELGSLDILVNNAGVNVHKKALDMTLEDFELIVKVNSKGVYFCCQAAARLMVSEKKGKIINIASAAAFLVRAGIPNSVYAMTKAGIVMLTKALAEEWAQHNINVNAVAPGYFATPLVADRLRDPEAYRSIVDSTPLKRVGGPEDIMGTVIFLSSEASNFITGQTICLDGGRTVL